MNRDIKFKAWDGKNMFSDALIAYSDGSYMKFEKPTTGEIIWLQYSGRKTIKGVEIYEGDILFYEEETDEGDERYYMVVVFIEEWNMFATLHIGEYKVYLDNGVENLDETMFWTYPLTESDHYHMAGNIYENENLLNSN